MGYHANFSLLSSSRRGALLKSWARLAAGDDMKFAKPPLHI